MEKFKQLKKIKEIYDNGDNIIQYLKSIGKENTNSIEDILISYDFQSGTYIKNLFENPELTNYCNAIAKIIDPIENVRSLMEVGVGEATTLSTVVRSLENKPPTILGFDISWSRLKFASELLADRQIKNVNLFTADLFEIPLLDSSVDVVYTAHSIEPNGGREEEALKELYRITNKYLILIEPSYEFASEEAKKRMEKHRYVTQLYTTAKKLGYNILEHRLFDYTINPLNPSGLMIIKKQASGSNSPDLVCPITHAALQRYNAYLMYSKESFLAYPVINGIPCLIKDNAILAIHLLTDYKEFKSRNNIRTGDDSPT